MWVPICANIIWRGGEKDGEKGCLRGGKKSGKGSELWRKRFITGQFGRRFNILGEAEVVSQLTTWTGKESVRDDCWKGRGEIEPVYANREVYGERAKSVGSCVSRGFLPARRVKKSGSAANYLK